LLIYYYLFVFYFAFCRIYLYLGMHFVDFPYEPTTFLSPNGYDFHPIGPGRLLIGSLASGSVIVCVNATRDREDESEESEEGNGDSDGEASGESRKRRESRENEANEISKFEESNRSNRTRATVPGGGRVADGFLYSVDDGRTFHTCLLTDPARKSKKNSDSALPSDLNRLEFVSIYEIPTAFSHESETILMILAKRTFVGEVDGERLPQLVLYRVDFQHAFDRQVRSRSNLRSSLFCGVFVLTFYYFEEHGSILCVWRLLYFLFIIFNLFRFIFGPSCLHLSLTISACPTTLSRGQGPWTRWDVASWGNGISTRGTR
jgi:hypothetical protein